MLRNPRSPRTGGCTFPEDPALTCAHVLPIWSAAVDPHVITARAFPIRPGGVHEVDLAHETVRTVHGGSGEHLVIDRDGVPLRLDVIEGTATAGPVFLHYDLPDDHRLEARIAVIRAIAGTRPIPCRHPQLANRLQALQALDARAAGASLREIADHVLGPGDWPGDGEHRKSLVRRLVAAGERMFRAGPRAVLEG